MKFILLIILLPWSVLCVMADESPFIDDGYHIDAEDLAEGNGWDEETYHNHMVHCYRDAAKKMRKIGVEPIDIEKMELMDHVCWSWATFVYFSFINIQMEDTEYRFYALSNENSLTGIFLTAAQLEKRLSEAKDWWEKPYIPTMKPPNYGAPK